jgi:hypothetical protein
MVSYIEITDLDHAGTGGQGKVIVFNIHECVRVGVQKPLGV